MFIYSFNGEAYKHHTYIPFIFGGVICYHATKKLDYQKPDNKLMEILTREVASVKDMRGQFYSLNHRYLRVNFNLNITSPSKWIYLLYLNESIAKELIEDLRANKTQYILLDATDNDALHQVLKSFIVSNYNEIMIHEEFILFKKNKNSVFGD